MATINWTGLLTLHVDGLDYPPPDICYQDDKTHRNETRVGIY